MLKQFLPEGKKYYEWDNFFDVIETLSVIIDKK